MTLGFERVVWCGVALYAIAALLLLGRSRAPAAARAPEAAIP